MFFGSFLIFVIALVAGMIVLSNCGLFLVFHVWVGIVVVVVGVSFLRSIVLSSLDEYTSVLLIITPRFICGERKICSTIEKSQNVMSMFPESNLFASISKIIF